MGTSADDILANLELINRYALALDTCDRDMLGSVFAEDVVFVARELEGRGAGVEILRLDGREAVVKLLAKLIGGLSSSHHMTGNHRVELSTDRNSAKGDCHVRAYHAGGGERAHIIEESLARFEFKTVRLGDGWKIRRMDETIMIRLGSADVFGDLN